MSLVSIGSDRIEYDWVLPPGARGTRTLVMLHEGLGSLSAWRDFPRLLAAATGLRTLVYSRRGYGRSTPYQGPRQPDYMHGEAHDQLPALLSALGVHEAVLFGHSDGASIALIHAAGADDRIAGVIALAPHVQVEEVTVRSIAATKVTYVTELRARLARHHDDPDATFWSWNDIWLDAAFRNWNIEKLLPAIVCPLLAIQGLDDEYGTLAQLEAIRRGVPQASFLTLPACRHSPHRDQPRAVLEASARFVAALTPMGDAGRRE